MTQQAVSLAEIRARQNALKAAREAEKLERKEAEDRGEVVLNLTSLQMDDMVEYAIRPLSELDLMYDASVHYNKGEQWAHEICEEHFRRDCKTCALPKNSKGYSMSPKGVKMGAFQVYNLIDAMVDAPDGDKVDPKTGKKLMKKVLAVPVRKVEFPWGQRDYIVNILKEGAKTAKDFKSKFTDMIFIIKRVSKDSAQKAVAEGDEANSVNEGKGGWAVPYRITLDELAERLGPEVSLELHPRAIPFTKLDKKAMRKVLLKDFKTLKPEDLKMLMADLEDTVVEDPNDPFAAPVATTNKVEVVAEKEKEVAKPKTTKAKETVKVLEEVPNVDALFAGNNEDIPF